MFTTQEKIEFLLKQCKEIADLSTISDPDGVESNKKVYDLFKSIALDYDPSLQVPNYEEALEESLNK